MTRLAQSSSSRAASYDRNPVTSVLQYLGGTIAPHAFVTRWTTTIAANKKARILSLQCSAQRVTVAGTPGDYSARITITPNGGAATDQLISRALGNLVDSGGIPVVLANVGEYMAGDVIAGGTQDLSTTGTVTYMAAATVQTFDA